MPPFFTPNPGATPTGPRLGTLHTSHGEIQTPVFMPVGTAATVKAMTVDEMEALGAEIILGNTYHLMLRPGEKTIQKLGGLHKFMAWERPILTDSGGYQVFSLAQRRKLKADGVEFQSHIDGTSYFLTPERAIEIQEALGSDIMMVLDECTPYPVSESEARKSMELTLDWAKRSMTAVLRSRGSFVGDHPSQLFGIIQGSIYQNLRKECVERLLDLNDTKNVNEKRTTSAIGGLAIGGLSVGEPKEELYAMAAHTAPLIPAQFPRYAMGIGLPEDLVELVGYGIDMFDCVVPTRNARNGQLFTTFGEIQIRHSRYAEDPRPIDENCACPTCKKYSRAYLRHLYMAKEILSSRLNTMHNLFYYLSLMSQIREAIRKDQYEEFRRDFYRNRISADDATRE